VELAAKLGIQGVFGVPLPGKFMVGYRDGPEGELQLVDVFERGKELTVEQAALELAKRDRLLEADTLEPANKRQQFNYLVQQLCENEMNTQKTITAESRKMIENHLELLEVLPIK
jgi:hypothetical protein